MKTEKRSILYISLEDTLQRMQQRLNDVRGGGPGDIWLATDAMCIGGGFEEQLVNLRLSRTLVQMPDGKGVKGGTVQKGGCLWQKVKTSSIRNPGGMNI